MRHVYLEQCVRRWNILRWRAEKMNARIPDEIWWTIWHIVQDDLSQCKWQVSVQTPLADTRQEYERWRIVLALSRSTEACIERMKSSIQRLERLGNLLTLVERKWYDDLESLRNLVLLAEFQPPCET